MNLRGLIRAEYEPMSSGTRISFTIVDGPIALAEGPESFEGGEVHDQSDNYAIHWKQTKNNLAMLRKIVEAMETAAE